MHIYILVYSWGENENKLQICYYRLLYFDGRTSLRRFTSVDIIGSLSPFHIEQTNEVIRHSRPWRCLFRHFVADRLTSFSSVGGCWFCLAKSPVDTLEMESDDQGVITPGAALLLIIGEPFSEDHKTLILAEITKGEFLLLK